MKYVRSFFMALSMFSIIPCPKYKWDENNARNILKFYPIVGFVIGLIWYVLYFILNKFNINTLLTSSILIAFPIYITGMLHLDGFMDVSDAILSRRDRETRLKILKDSCTGAFAVISLIILLLIEFAAMNIVLESNKNMLFIILIPVFSRSFSALMILVNEELKESTLVKFFKKGTGLFDRILQMIIIILSFILTYVIFGFKYDIILLIMCIFMGYKTYKNIKDLGGINGDIAGYNLVIGEFFGILALSLI